MPVERRVSLLNGLWQDGVCHDRAVLRSLTGADEIALAEAEVLPAAQATTLLSTTVQAIGAIAPVTGAHVRHLTIGDRERLLLALYAQSFGPQADVILRCPDCAETIELPLDLEAMLEASAIPPRAPEHSITVGPLTLRFRVPNGADHERAARIAATDPDRGAAALRAACVIAVTGVNAGETAPEEMPDRLQAALEDALRRLDPDAETILAVDCPACGERASGTLDAVSLLAGQLGPSGGILIDVDHLARAYHWSEAAILGLPTARRHRYLALVARAEAEAA